MRPGAARANAQESFYCLCDAWRFRSVAVAAQNGVAVRNGRLKEDVAAAEFAVGVFVDIAVFFDAIAAGENGGGFRAERGHQLSVGPNVKCALAFFVRM